MIEQTTPEQQAAEQVITDAPTSKVIEQPLTSLYINDFEQRMMIEGFREEGNDLP